MPGSIIGELFFRVIFEMIFEVVFYYIGRVVVPIISLGQLKCDRITADTPRRKLRGGGVFHRRGQQTYLTAEATAVVGLLFVLTVVACVLLIRYSNDS